MPDGSAFFLATDDGRDVAAVARYNLKSGKLEIIESPEHEVTSVRLGHHGRYVAWVTNDVGFSHLFVRDLSTGKDIKIPPLPRGALDIDFAAEAPVLAVTINGPQSPGDVVTWNVATGTTARVVRASNGGLNLDGMVTPEVVSFKARDGVVLTALLYLPAGVQKPPVLLAVHGGPTSHATAAFQADKQYYVARGIAVFDLNYRGSSGFGKAFAALNDKELHVNEINDIADAIAWLKSYGRVDTQRAAIGGVSYGGYLTNAALGTFPDMFVAGLSAVGVSDWVTALQGAEPSLHASDIDEYGDVADPKVRDFFARLSPINNVGKIKTPILVETGANDPRDPPTESDRLVEGIRKAGGTVSYIRFPNEGHTIKIIANRIYYYRRVAAFLEEHFGLSQPVH